MVLIEHALAVLLVGGLIGFNSEAIQKMLASKGIMQPPPTTAPSFMPKPIALPTDDVARTMLLWETIQDAESLKEPEVEKKLQAMGWLHQMAEMTKLMNPRPEVKPYR